MKSLGNVWIAFKTTPPALIVIGVGAFVYLVAKIFVFDAMPEIFSHAYEVGRLVQNLLEATVAAIVFFVFSFQLPAVVEQRRVGPAVFSLVDRVVGSVIGGFDRVYRGRPEHPVPNELRLADITQELVTSVFNSVSPNGYCNSMVDPETGKLVGWIDSLNWSNQRCLQSIDMIWRYARFLDAEVAAMLSEIEASGYVGILRSVASNKVPIGNPNLDFLATDYVSVLDMAMRLAKRAEELRKRYGMQKTFGG